MKKLIIGIVSLGLVMTTDILAMDLVCNGGNIFIGDPSSKVEKIMGLRDNKLIGKGLFAKKITKISPTEEIVTDIEIWNVKTYGRCHDIKIESGKVIWISDDIRCGDN
jgi:hypothetical protein